MLDEVTSEQSCFNYSWFLGETWREMYCRYILFCDFCLEIKLAWLFCKQKVCGLAHFFCHIQQKHSSRVPLMSLELFIAPAAQEWLQKGTLLAGWYPFQHVFHHCHRTILPPMQLSQIRKNFSTSSLQSGQQARLNYSLPFQREGGCVDPAVKGGCANKCFLLHITDISAVRIF